MIRFSAILVAAAIAVLVTGVLASNLALVYASIVASVLAAALLAVGVLLRRDEIFGDAGSARAVRQSARPIPGGAGAPVMVGGRARISRDGGRDADPAAVIANGDAGAEAGQDAKSGAWKAMWGKSAPDQADTAKAGSPKPGPAKAGPGRAGGRIGGGYSGAHSSGRGRSTTAPPGRGRGATAPPTGAGARGPGGPWPGGSAPGDAGPPRVGTSASDLAGGPAGRPGAPADPPAGSAGLNGRSPADQAGIPAQDRGGSPPGLAGSPPDWAGSPPDLAESPPDWAGSPSDLAGSPPDWAGTSSGHAGNGRPEPAGPRPPAGGAEDAPPAQPPGLPPASLVPGWPHGPVPYSAEHDDFWDRVSEELDAGAQRGSTAPPWAATAGPRAMGAGRTDAPVGDAPADEAVPADDTGPGHGRAEPGVGPLPEDQRWIAWAPGGGERADAAPSAGGAQEPADAGARDEEARPAGSPASSRDSVPDVGDEKEETAPSPWSIPLSLVGDLDEMEDDGVWHVPDAGTADDAEQPAADDGLSADGHDDEDAADGEGKPERGHDGDAARMAAPGPGALPLTVDDADATKSAGETAGTPAISGQNGAEGGPAREEVASPARVEPVAEDPAEVNASGEPDHADDVPRASTADQAPAAGEAATHDEASASGSAPDASASGSAPDASASGSEPGSSETRAAAAGPTGESAGAAADSGARAGADAEETSSATATPSANASEPSAGDLQPDSGRDSSSSANGGPRPAASATSASPAGGDRQEVNEEVTMVPGVARYHRSGCILIRFLGGDDLETTTRQAAEADGCVPCRACEPDKPLSADRG